MDIFKNKKFVSEKLEHFGFVNQDGRFIYSTEIVDGLFCLNIQIYENKVIKTELVEKETNEVYYLHLTDAEGTFLGKVREEYFAILNSVVEKCCENNIFKEDYTNALIEYIRKKYGDKLEYLWEKSPDCAISRRKDNKKWYLVILTVGKDKFGFETTEKVEVLNIRADKESVPYLMDHSNIYPAYHMNKKNWISVILDGTVPLDEIFSFVDESYVIAGKR